MRSWFRYTHPLAAVIAAFTAVALIALLTGCVQPAVRPETPRQTLALVDSQFTGLVRTAADLRAQQVLTDPALISEIDGIITRGDAALDAAWLALGAGDTATLQGQLAIVDAVLLELRDAVAEAQAQEARHE